MPGIYVGTPTTVSDMQGPCPDGYHIPTNDEWVELCGILTNTFGLASNGATMQTYLKMPYSGCRKYTDSNTTGQNSNGYYRSCTSQNNNFSYQLVFQSTSITQMSQFYAVGLSIRPFKDDYITPDSSWTSLYSDKIYHNSTLGLISIKKGTGWITIADKNLGATQVYNSGNTLSEANCGKYYQWGNNYGFPFTGSVTTSSTQVDASNYGPGNYYSSSTFIIGSYNWSSVQNANLWGGVTQGTTTKGEVKSIYVGTTPVKEVYVGTTKVRPSADTRTFTISRTEKSDMSSGWTYSDDAAGLTAGSTEFDKFFGYYGCRLNASGVETAKVTQEESGGAGKLDITRLGTLTSGDNVMIAFPVMGIKMSKSGSTVTLSITKELNKSGYQYYAHSTGTLSNPGTPKDVFYLGAYKGYSSSNVIKSWSGQSPTVSQTQATFITRAKANGSGWNISGFYQREYIHALYFMKYGNPDFRSVIGQGYTGGSTEANTGGTNSQTSATYGTSSTTTQAKLFGLEDWEGNLMEFIGGMYTDGSRVLYTSLTGWSGALSGGESTGATLATNSTYYMTKIVGDNKGMFMASGIDSYSTYYYRAYAYIVASCLGAEGTAYNYGTSSYQPFSASVRYRSYTSPGDVGSRLMYLQGLT